MLPATATNAPRLDILGAARKQLADAKTNISAKQPTISDQLNALPARWFVIDGERVVLDGDGRLARLMFGQKGTRYSAFDLLWLENDDLRPTRWNGASRFFKICFGPPDRADIAIRW